MLPSARSLVCGFLLLVGVCAQPGTNEVKETRYMQLPNLKPNCTSFPIRQTVHVNDVLGYITPLKQEELRLRVSRQPFEEMMILDVPAHCLIQPLRFDFMSKVLYGEHLLRKDTSEFPNLQYKSHLRVLNGYNEADGTSKHGFESFDQVFVDLIELLSGSSQLDVRQGLIPGVWIGDQSVDFVPSDGAHRIAAALITKKTVPILASGVMEEWPMIRSFGSDLFRSLGTSTVQLDAMAVKYAELETTSFMVTLFPGAVNSAHMGTISGMLQQAGNVVYSKSLELRGYGPYLLIQEFYNQDDFVTKNFGNVMDQWICNKATACFGQRDETELWGDKEWPLGFYNRVSTTNLKTDCRLKGKVLGILIESNLEKMKKVKAEIRGLFDLGHHSVHITDTHQEATRLARLMFSEAGRSFLNIARPVTMPNFNKHIKILEEWSKAVGLSPENFVVDTSGSYAMHGIRDLNDIDIILSSHMELRGADGRKIRYVGNGVEIRDYNGDEYIWNPRYHFWYMGFKFATLETTLLVKQWRNMNTKDAWDVDMVDYILDHPSSKR